MDRDGPSRQSHAGIAQLVEQLICNWKRLIFKTLHSFAKRKKISEKRDF
jgi:hypothetical protein